ncbi:hypothetical protein APUTEX25_002497 [Auxenochlorella protothecoides]|uniref:AB hydrolase-1 domain-containing protein n=1 Tax=Auxenochlorella protothecoides TaxID=3075 RepID=A0A3M7KRE8_AUXPR|nr:hypothetical protein APUTEX25_002497 [Auxenochlorella protothecoides]|eukprot:RMZ53088.1 hypothetical protein APUTEX25_002497 [Auxenochlorella protothecoides]
METISREWVVLMLIPCLMALVFQAGHVASNRANSGKALAAASAEPAPAPPLPSWQAGTASHTWTWRGNKVCYLATDAPGPAILLVHGFGACSAHWRACIPALAARGFRVYALDLLGHGGSDKPPLAYTLELWREQVADFLAQVVAGPAVLVGNSIGSLVSLMVAAQAGPAAPPVHGVALVNCAGGLNNKAVSEDWRARAARPLFLLIDALLARRRVARWLFDKYRSPENIRSILLKVYRDPASVDDELVQMLHAPSCQPGALEAFVSIMSGPPGPQPKHLVPDIGCPLLVFWGTADPFTPLAGPVGRYFQALPSLRPGTRFVGVPGAGHCPHDETPQAVLAELLPWLETVKTTTQAVA